MKYKLQICLIVLFTYSVSAQDLAVDVLSKKNSAYPYKKELKECGKIVLGCIGITCAIDILKTLGIELTNRHHSPLYQTYPTVAYSYILRPTSYILYRYLIKNIFCGVLYSIGPLLASRLFLKGFSQLSADTVFKNFIMATELSIHLMKLDLHWGMCLTSIFSTLSLIYHRAKLKQIDDAKGYAASCNDTP